MLINFYSFKLLKMKYFTLLVMKKMLLFVVSTCMILPTFAQNAPIDFEAAGNGANWTWTVFENDTNPPLEIITNPDPTGANTSATVAKFTALQAGMPFAGCETMHGADIGTFNIDATNSTIKIMVWKTVISDVGIKLVANDGGALPEIKVANTLINQWEELTFDFSAQNTLTYDQIVVFPDFNARAADNIVYFDNITFGPEIAVGEPMTAAPDPTEDPADVISMFSNVYTDVAVDTWKTSWSVATLEDIQIQGNDTKKYTGLSFVGVETVGPNLIDASTMTHFHIDVWTPNMTTLKIKLVDFGANAVFDGGDDTEHELIFENPAQGEWISYDIPLTDFTGLINTDHMAQFIFSSIPAGGGVLYVDNVYFYEGGTISEPMTAAPDPTEDPANVISMFSNVYTDVAVDTWKTNWSVATLEDIQIQGNDTKKYTGLSFVGVETVGPNLIDASTMTHFHIDVWTPNMTTLKIKLVDFGANAVFDGGDDTEHELIFENPAQGEWISYDIPLTDFTGLINTDHMAQFIFSSIPAGGGVLYVDNVYFSKDATSVSSFEENNIELFPNPVQSYFTIRADQIIEEIRVFDILGSLVMNERVMDNNAHLNIAHLVNGTYIIVAIIDGKPMVDRLIKN